MYPMRIGFPSPHPSHIYDVSEMSQTIVIKKLIVGYFSSTHWNVSGIY